MKILKYTIYVVIGGNLALSCLQVAKLQNNNDIEQIVSITGEAQDLLNKTPKEIKENILSMIKSIPVRRRMTKFIKGAFEDSLESELLPAEVISKLIHYGILIFSNDDGEIIIYDSLSKANKVIKNNSKKLNDNLKEESVRKYVSLKLKTTLLQS